MDIATATTEYIARHGEYILRDRPRMEQTIEVEAKFAAQHAVEDEYITWDDVDAFIPEYIRQMGA